MNIRTELAVIPQCTRQVLHARKPGILVALLPTACKPWHFTILHRSACSLNLPACEPGSAVGCWKPSVVAVAGELPPTTLPLVAAECGARARTTSLQSTQS